VQCCSPPLKKRILRIIPPPPTPPPQTPPPPPPPPPKKTPPNPPSTQLSSPNSKGKTMTLLSLIPPNSSWIGTTLSSPLGAPMGKPCAYCIPREPPWFFLSLHPSPFFPGRTVFPPMKMDMECSRQHSANEAPLFLVLLFPEIGSNPR